MIFDSIRLYKNASKKGKCPLVARPAFNPLFLVHAFGAGNDEKIKDRRVCLGGEW